MLSHLSRSVRLTLRTPVASRLFHSSRLMRDAAPAPGSHQVSDRVKMLAHEIPLLNLIEVNDLLKLLQTKLGLPDMSMQMAAPVAAAAAPAGGAPAAGAAPAAAAPAAAKTEFGIKLVKFDAAAKIKIIKEVRELTKLDLKAAKDLVEAAPKTLIKDLKKDEADKAMEKLKAAGAVCELE